MIYKRHMADSKCLVSSQVRFVVFILQCVKVTKYVYSSNILYTNFTNLRLALESVLSLQRVVLYFLLHYN